MLTTVTTGSVGFTLVSFFLGCSNTGTCSVLKSDFLLHVDVFPGLTSGNCLCSLAGRETMSYSQLLSTRKGFSNFFFSVHHLKCGPLTCIPPYITKVRGSALGCHFISPHTLSVCLSSVPCRTQTLEISTCVSLSVVRNTNTLRRVAVSRGSWWSPDSRSTLATWRATNPRGATRTWGSCS